MKLCSRLQLSVLTICKFLPNIVLDFHNIGPVERGGIHELTLMRAACQLTEQGHQIEITRRTPVCQSGEERIERLVNAEKKPDNINELKGRTLSLSKVVFAFSHRTLISNYLDCS